MLLGIWSGRTAVVGVMLPELRGVVPLWGEVVVVAAVTTVSVDVGVDGSTSFIFFVLKVGVGV